MEYISQVVTLSTGKMDVDKGKVAVAVRQAMKSQAKGKGKASVGRATGKTTQSEMLALIGQAYRQQ